MNRAEVIARLKAVEPQLRAHGVAALYLFGSYARDEAREDSDVDVFIDRTPQQEFGLDEFLGVYETLSAAVPVHVDYGTRTGLSKFLREDIEREAVRIF